jgi:hypothetical protein
MAVGAKRYALLLRLADRLGYVSLPHRQLIDRTLAFFDQVVKVDDRWMRLSAMATALLRLVSDPLCSILIPSLPGVIDNLSSV